MVAITEFGAILGNNIRISGLYVFVFLTMVLLAGTTVPLISSQPPQSTALDVSQIVKQIAERVASANNDTSVTFVEQILTELARQSSQVPNQGNALEEIRSQILTFPYGVESQSLARFANLLSADSSALVPIVQKILQEQSGGKSASQSIVNIAVQDATGGGRNVNDEIALAAQIIAKQLPGIPIRNVESIIIQMALEISRAQGKAITGQTIFEIASQIKQNPNGVLTQAILQLAKKDMQENGKSGQTVNIIQKVVKASRDGEDKDDDQRQQQSTNKLASPTSPVPIPPTSPVPIPPTSPVPIPPTSPVPIPPTSPSVPTKGLTTYSPQPRLGPLDMLLVHGGRYIIDYALGPGAAARIDKYAEDVIAASPLISKVFALLTATDISLRAVNNAGPSQAIQALNALFSTESDPGVLQKFGQVAALYQTGDDISAAHTTDIVANKLIAGIGPAVAIEETTIPEPEVSLASAQTVTEPLSAEPEVKSLPPSDMALLAEMQPAVVEPFGIVEPDIPVEALLGQEPIGQEGLVPVPGVGPQSPTEPQEQLEIGEGESLEVQEEPAIAGEEPSRQEELTFFPGTGISPQPTPSEEQTSQPSDQEPVEEEPSPTDDLEEEPAIEEVPLRELLQPTGDEEPIVAEVEEEPALATEPQEQPEIEQEEPSAEVEEPSAEVEDLEEAVEEEPTPSTESKDVDGQYSVEPGSYQEEEESGGEEEDRYEEVGNYQAAEADYSEEEESGDEEDDYEEIGNYQEEEEQYTEEDNEEEEDFHQEEEERDNEEEEDFTEEDGESEEFYEE